MSAAERARFHTPSSSIAPVNQLPLASQTPAPPMFKPNEEVP